MQTTDKTAKHTEGPWQMAAKPSSIVGWPVVQQSTGRVICTLNYIQHTQIDPVVAGDRAFNAESRANARLIASAPELLEALRLFERQWNACGPNSDFGRYFQNVRDAARAAILKATGGA